MWPEHSLLFRWITGFIKYFFLVTVGLTGAFLLAVLFGHGYLALALMNYLLDWWWRLAAGSFLVLGCIVIFDSFK